MTTRAAIALALTLTAAGCKKSLAGNTLDGGKVFASVCASCHGPTGKPSPSQVATLHARDLTAPEFRARVTVELVKKQVQRGSDNKLMPSFAGALSEQQIDAVARYVTDGLVAAQR